MYLNDVFTVPANLAGIPGISVPAGFSEAGLPLGLQVLSGAFCEDTLYQVARCLELQAGIFRSRHVMRLLVCKGEKGWTIL